MGIFQFVYCSTNKLIYCKQLGVFVSWLWLFMVVIGFQAYGYFEIQEISYWDYLQMLQLIHVSLVVVVVDVDVNVNVVVNDDGYYMFIAQGYCQMQQNQNYQIMRKTYF